MIHNIFSRVSRNPENWKKCEIVSKPCSNSLTCHDDFLFGAFVLDWPNILFSSRNPKRLIDDTSHSTWIVVRIQGGLEGLFMALFPLSIWRHWLFHGSVYMLQRNHWLRTSWQKRNWKTNFVLNFILPLNRPFKLPFSVSSWQGLEDSKVSWLSWVCGVIKDSLLIAWMYSRISSLLFTSRTFLV